MLRTVRAALCGLLAALAALTARAQARPFTIDDLLRTEFFGRTVVDPTGRWAVIERTDPYETALRFDYDLRMPVALGRLLIADLAAQAGAARPLLVGAEGPGLVAGPFAPDGRRLAVFRLRGDDWRLGVASIPDGAVTWLDVTPEDPSLARSVQWRSPTELLVLARPDRTAPRLLRRNSRAARELPARYATTASGGVAASVFGSGRWRSSRPQPPPLELRRIDLATGDHRRLARGAFTEFQLSPRGDLVAVLEAGEDRQPLAGRPVDGPDGFSNRRHGLRLVRVADGGVQPRCQGLDVLERLLAWSPSGGALLVYARRPQDPWPQGALRRVEPGGETCAPLAPAGFQPQVGSRPDRVEAGWMGEAPIALGRLPAGQLSWVRLGASPTPLTGHLPVPPPVWSTLDAGGGLAVAGDALLRIDPRGAATVLARGVAAARPARRAMEPGAAALAPAEPRALVSRPSPSGLQIAALGDGARPNWRTLPADSRLVGYSRGRDVLLAQAKDARGVERVFAVDAAGRVRDLATANAHLTEVTPPRARSVRHQAPDGRPLTSWLLLPPRAPGSAPPALIVTPYLGESYPGPRRDNLPPMLDFTVDPRVMVGAGYAVLLPSLPRDRADPAPWANLANRLLQIVDAAAADPALRGAFDADRLALWGLSFGGFTTAHAITQTERFGAAIVCNAPIDPLAVWGVFQPEWRMAPELGIFAQQSMAWTETAQLGLGGPPWSTPDRYVAANPVYAADRITTPVLILHGDQDPIGLDNAELLFSALYRQDKDAQLVTYWGEGHLTASPGSLRDRYARAFAFLRAHLIHSETNLSVSDLTWGGASALPAQGRPGEAGP